MGLALALVPLPSGDGVANRECAPLHGDDVAGAGAKRWIFAAVGAMMSTRQFGCSSVFQGSLGVNCIRSQLAVGISLFCTWTEVPYELRKNIQLS